MFVHPHRCQLCMYRTEILYESLQGLWDGSYFRRNYPLRLLKNLRGSKSQVVAFEVPTADIHICFISVKIIMPSTNLRDNLSTYFTQLFSKLLTI